VLNKIILIVLLLASGLVLADGVGNLTITSIAVHAPKLGYADRVYIKFDQALTGGCQGVYFDFAGTNQEYMGRLYSTALMAKASQSKVFVSFSPTTTVVRENTTDTYCESPTIEVL